jgi:hypothetical protein
MKVSPNGKKLGLANRIYPPPNDIFELYDFDNSTGMVSNQLVLLSNVEYAYGCEFSPDGTKFYGSLNGPAKTIIQWDLCAGSNSAIVASNYSINTPTGANNAMQLAVDGKIYIAKADQYLAAISHPNIIGIGCVYTNTVFSIAPNYCSWGLPNFLNTHLRPKAAQFSQSSSCHNFSFSALPSIGNTCAFAANTVSALQWNFGDPGSGVANTGSLSTVTHSYSNGGTYTVQLLLQYDCYTDTLKQVIQVNVPQLSVSGKTVICNKDKLSLTASGANTYSWSSGASTANYTATPSTAMVYTVTGTNTITGCSSAKVVSVSVNPCLGLIEQQSGNDVQVYPNPSKGIFFVVAKETCRLKIYNQLAAQVYETIIQKGENRIDLQHLNAGMYFAEIAGQMSAITYKVFIERE